MLENDESDFDINDLQLAIDRLKYWGWTEEAILQLKMEIALIGATIQ